MPTDFQLKTMNGVHRALLKVTGGRIGNQIFGMPSLELTTIGRKSGTPRPVMLTTPIIDGDTVVVVASRGGDPTHPAWFLNLRDNPEVEVSLAQGPRKPMLAHVATPEERAQLWPRVVSAYKGYGDYQTKTTREIPLVLLTPRT
ncbi:nitroreductase family deazaflavin-dependent oxidoreductase [Nocardia mangyaensis]|uniref:nitroreductase family deazaflavin-dependent oxidoreductase n=1 Tax=Nocardia mangyaensis TaxID=2213200 RepID=UPI0026751E40|nr:nitroreductase family deazaflavin-dependent oxidoreductase [Nocardia mangyaensis]MDO3649673.1 nitroreductase family deazaflavin-dependent oxidoreductase [Nocardia mangyaensis]